MSRNYKFLNPEGVYFVSFAIVVSAVVSIPTKIIVILSLRLRILMLLLEVLDHSNDEMVYDRIPSEDWNLFTARDMVGIFLVEEAVIY